MTRRSRYVRYTIRIPAQAAARLARLAARRGMPAADVARACVMMGLAQLSDPSEPPLETTDLLLRWEEVTRQVHALIRKGGATAYRAALIRRLVGLSVDRWEVVDQWFEERAAHAPAGSARLLAKEALVYFGLPAKVLPTLITLAQRVRHRLYMRALRRTADGTMAASP